MDLVKKNQKLHNGDLPLIISDVKDDDVVKEVREPSYIKVRVKFYISCVSQSDSLRRTLHHPCSGHHLGQNFTSTKK